MMDRSKLLLLTCVAALLFVMPPLFAVINIGLISWCFWLVKTNFVESDEVT